MRQISAQEKVIIPIGRQGENGAAEIIFDVSGWADLYGNGAFELLNRRPAENTPYTCSITVSDEQVHWIVQSADVALVGHGRCELTYVVDDVIAKSVVFATCVLPSIEGAGEVPEPYESRIQDLIVASAEAVIAAQDSEAYAAGTRDGADVPSDDPAYHNNSKYYSSRANSSANTAQGYASDAGTSAAMSSGSALKSEGFAVGTANGRAVASTSPYYHNNSKYYAEQASGSATAAAGSATAADGSASAAAGSATAADESATAAAGSETAAAGSATAAAGSATAAAGSATAAAGSASDAAAQLALVTAEGTRQVGLITAEGTTQKNAVIAKGQEVIESIPEDYSDLTSDVEDLKSSIGMEQDSNEVKTSKNKWNPTEETRNANISNSSATLGDIISGAYNVSGLIPVSKGNLISYYFSNDSASGMPPVSMGIAQSAFRIAEYKKDGTCILVTSNWVRLPYKVQNAETYFIRLASGLQYNWNMVIVNDNDMRQKPFVTFEPNLNLQTDNSARISTLETNLTSIENPAEVIVPSHIYGVNGQQINVYKENMMLYNRLKSMAYIHTQIPNSEQSDERTIWNPTAQVLTENTVNFEIFKYGTVSQPINKQITVCSVPKDTGSSSIKVLIIGDSKVDNGYVSYHFLHNFDDDNMSCTLLGTKYDWQTDNRNEGYGSRTAKWFCTDSASPFCNNGAFDFANYLTVNSIDTPDYVFINLGTNDCGGLLGSNDIFLAEFVTYIEQMITSIHSVSENIVVCVGMCEGCCTVDDTSTSAFLIWDLNQKISRLHKTTIENFDNRQSENIYICPMYLGMDLTQDYNMTEVPLSQRDGDVNNGQGNGKTRMQVTDRVHQNEVGYWKNADYMYALVKYIVAKSNS